jgi:hypothetical protein
MSPEDISSFIEATLENARNTRLEPGNVRFDVLQAEQPTTRFLLYEAYRSADDFRQSSENGALLTVARGGGRHDGPATRGGSPCQPVFRRSNGLILVAPGRPHQLSIVSNRSLARTGLAT